LYASGCLEGATTDWWDAYTTAHAAVDTITCQEFQEAFRTHDILAGVIKLKLKEFLALKQDTCLSVNIGTSSPSCLVILQMKLTQIQKGKNVSWVVSKGHLTTSFRVTPSPTFRLC
jgi:hypothetical protein